MLWVSADPGCGKSVLAKYLIDDVLPSTGTRTTCYFFFKDDFEDQKSLESALRCILRQLFHQRPALLSDKIIRKVEADGDKLFASSRNLWNIFIDAISNHSTEEIVCVLDALDECEEKGRAQLVAALSKLYSIESSKSNLKFLLTSRPDMNIGRDFQPLKAGQPTIHLSAENEVEVEKISHESDLVIKKRVEELSIRLKLRPEEKQLVEHELTTVTNRTYLWVHLVFDVIKNCVVITEGNLRANIQSLPKTAYAAYDKILRNSSDVDKAKKLLHIVVAADRPLSLREIATALAIDEHDRSYRDLELEPEARFRQTVRAIWGLFVVIIDSKVYLLHQTAREFLIRPPSFQSGSTTLKWQHSLHPAESNKILAEICMWCLFSTDFKTPNGKDPPILLDYSAKSWAAHFRRADTVGDTSRVSSALRLCTDPQRCSMWFKIYWETTRSKFPENCTPLIVASSFGLHQVVGQLLRKRRANPKSLDTTYGRSALSWASENGHDSVVELILNRVHKLEVLFKTSGIVNSKDELNRTPLFYAAMNGHERIAKMLLKKGAKVESRDSYSQTPWSWAAHNGHAGILELLLKNGAKHADMGNYLESTDLAGRTLLMKAVVNGDEAVVKLLLENNADIESRDNNGWTALSHAASRGHEAVVKLLLENNADIESRNNNGKTALSYAALMGHKAVVKLLKLRSMLVVLDHDREAGVA